MKTYLSIYWGFLVGVLRRVRHQAPYFASRNSGVFHLCRTRKYGPFQQMYEYNFHNETFVGQQGTQGWQRNMWFSIVQQIARQDLGYYLAYVWFRPDHAWRLVSFPWFAKSTKAGFPGWLGERLAYFSCIITAHGSPDDRERSLLPFQSGPWCSCERTWASVAGTHTTSAR